MSEVTAPTAAPAAPAAGTEHRARLLEGMARAVAAKGYADTTIADIVREASVSRRTFYENFADKAECLTALYEAASGNAIAVLRAAIDPRSDWEAQVEQAMAAYFGVLARNPVLLRTLFIDILGLGPTGLAARRRANQQLADLMLDVVNNRPAQTQGPTAAHDGHGRGGGHQRNGAAFHRAGPGRAAARAGGARFHVVAGGNLCRVLNL